MFFAAVSCAARDKKERPLDSGVMWPTRSWLAYMTEQQPASLSPLTFLTVRATRAASVKASFTPRFFMAEHSADLLADCNLEEHVEDGIPPSHL